MRSLIPCGVGRIHPSRHRQCTTHAPNDAQALHPPPLRAHEASNWHRPYRARYVVHGTHSPFTNHTLFTNIPLRTHNLASESSTAYQDGQGVIPGSKRSTLECSTGSLRARRDEDREGMVARDAGGREPVVVRAYSVVKGFVRYVSHSQSLRLLAIKQPDDDVFVCRASITRPGLEWRVSGLVVDSDIRTQARHAAA